MEKVYEMSPANKITVFPDGHAAETEVVKAERTAHAKLAAARIRHEEGTER